MPSLEIKSFVKSHLFHHSERLEATVRELSEELSTRRDELIVLKDEHEQTEIELEKQQHTQNERNKEFTDKESRWKNRFVKL